MNYLGAARRYVYSDITIANASGSVNPDSVAGWQQFIHPDQNGRANAAEVMG